MVFLTPDDEVLEYFIDIMLEIVRGNMPSGLYEATRVAMENMDSPNPVVRAIANAIAYMNFKGEL